MCTLNDIVENVSSNVKLFADDTAIYVDVDKRDMGQEIINKDFESIKLWSDQWLVNFNVKKTTAMNTFLKHNACDPILYFQNEQLKLQKVYKHLGVISNKLTYQLHMFESQKACKHYETIEIQIRQENSRNYIHIIRATYSRIWLYYLGQL